MTHIDNTVSFMFICWFGMRVHVCVCCECAYNAFYVTTLQWPCWQKLLRLNECKKRKKRNNRTATHKTKRTKKKTTYICIHSNSYKFRVYVNLMDRQLKKPYNETENTTKKESNNKQIDTRSQYPYDAVYFFLIV